MVFEFQLGKRSPVTIQSAHGGDRNRTKRGLSELGALNSFNLAVLGRSPSWASNTRGTKRVAPPRVRFFQRLVFSPGATISPPNRFNQIR